MRENCSWSNGDSGDAWLLAYDAYCLLFLSYLHKIYKFFPYFDVFCLIYFFLLPPILTMYASCLTRILNATDVAGEERMVVMWTVQRYAVVICGIESDGGRCDDGSIGGGSGGGGRSMGIFRVFSGFNPPMNPFMLQIT